MKPTDAYETARLWADKNAEELVENHRGRVFETDGILLISPTDVEAPVVHAVQRLCDFFEIFPHPDDASAVLSLQEALIELISDANEIVGAVTARRPVNRDQLARFTETSSRLIAAHQADPDDV